MFALVSLLCLLAVANYAGAERVVRGEPHGWLETDVAPEPNELVEFRLALHQRNVDKLEAEVLERSNPSSSLYGKWLSSRQVLDLIAPDAAAVDEVVAWARAAGLRADGSRRDVVLVAGARADVERALETRLRVWRHADSGFERVGTREYALPAGVARHVELLSGLTEFWLPPRGSAVRTVDATTNKGNSTHGLGNNVQAGYVIPETIRRLYNIPFDDYRDVSAYSSVCVAEFQDNARYSHRDLRYFDRQTGEHHSHVDHIVGPFQGAQPSGESELDIQYASTIALNSSYWYWTVQGWMFEFANDLTAHGTNSPDVISMSWGWPEPQQCQITQCNGMTSTQYVRRVDTEWMKLVATGKTLVAASGDQGAPGDTYAQGCDGISDTYPGASPWVLSVGATMLNNNAQPAPPPPMYQPPPICQQKTCSMITEEIVCTIPEALITTGGGFSAYEPMPKWQETAVQAYLNNPNIQFPPKSMFNPRNRAFPDIAAMGHAFLIAMNEQMIQVDGTSASSPVAAAMIALYNGWRLKNGKTTLGFINPLLYQIHAKDPSAFKDITQGNNKCSEGCCGNYGFEATQGWDATTGLGGMYFPKILDYIKQLP